LFKRNLGQTENAIARYLKTRLRNFC